MDLLTVLEKIHVMLWGAPLLILVVGVGIYMTVLLKGIQFRYLGYALKLAFARKHKKGEGDISHFQALMTALAGTIGISNIAGVATAIAVGGLGALFWMWVLAFLGMATRFAEAVLAVKYREKGHTGEMCGGPMYYIRHALGWRRMAALFAVCGAVAALGGGNMIQANSIADALRDVFAINPWHTGIVMSVATGVMLVGGIKSIGRAASLLVPLMAFLYLTGGLVILALHVKLIPGALMLVVKSAFHGQAAFGGFAGTTAMLAMRMGASRGISSSEAGLGSGAIAAAAAKTDSPGRQAMVAMTGTFLAAFVMCSITGLVLAVTGVFGRLNVDGSMLNGAPMTIAAFASNIPWGQYVVVVSLILFGYTTVIGWAYYGEKCVEFLFGYRAINVYRVLFASILIPGAAIDLQVVWIMADIGNGLMALPNLIGILVLAPVVAVETKAFLALLARERGVPVRSEG